MSHTLSVNVPVLLPLTLLERNTGQIQDVPKNARFIRDEKYKKLVKSLTDHPSMMSLRELLVYQVGEKYVVIGGNMRLRALQELGYTEAPCKVIDPATPSQELRAIVMKDNIGYGEHDWELVANEWDQVELEDWGLDIPEMTTLEESAEEDEYEMPEEIQTDIVQGDMFELKKDGKVLHRLLCGDSTKIDDVEKLMGGEKADIGFTSPPYNSGGADFTYDYKSKKQGGFYQSYKDDLTKKEYFEFCISVLQNYYTVLNKECHSLFWNVMYNANSRDDYGKIVFSEMNPFSVRETIIWDKGHGFPVAGEQILSRICELLFLLSSSTKYLSNQHNKTIYWNKWEVSTGGDTQDSKNKHKACFPIGLPSKAITDFSKEQHMILDLFLGSGTTMVASHQLNRRCYGIELDPKYCQVILDRMKKLDPELEIVKVQEEIYETA